jgi:hypothetical protein
VTTAWLADSEKHFLPNSYPRLLACPSRFDEQLGHSRKWENFVGKVFHRASRRALLIALGSFAVMACASLPKLADAPLADIVRRNTQARGGAAALDRVHSLTAKVEIDEGGQKLNGLYAVNDKGLVRVDVYANGKSVFSEGVDDKGAWNWSPGKPPTPSVDAGRAALLNGAENHLFGWHRFEERGHKLTLMPAAMIDGVSHSVVEVRYATGQVSYFYLDPKSWLVVRRRDERAYHPDIDPTKQKMETRFSEFRKSDGLTVSTADRDYDLSTGKLIATFRSFDRHINPPLPSNHFDRNRRAPAVW